MRTIATLEKSKSFWFFFIISFVFFLLRFPSLFEPYWYGDEGIYHVLGDAINKGAILYRDTWDNKPPLLYIIYSVFNSDQFLIRFASIIFGLTSIALFFTLVKSFFKNQKTQYLTTVLFSVLFGLPLLEGNIANAENFMLAPILASALFIFNFLKSKNFLLLFLSGIFLSIAFLFKIVAIFDFAAFLLFLIFIDKNVFTYLRKKKITSSLKGILVFILGFLSPILLTSFFFLINDAFSEFLKATLFANVPYVGYGNKFLIPQGLLFLKFILLFSFILFLFVKRKFYTSPSLFILLWLGFSLFNAFFSQRPYAHYLLVLLPSFSFLVGLCFDLKFKKIALSILAIVLLLILTNFGFYGKTIFYYQNFLSFITGEKSVYAYNRFFDRRTPTDYELAMYIKNNTSEKDSIFIWGNNAQVYALAKKLPPGRYAVAYHITSSKDGVKETQEDLDIKKPKLIIIMPYMKFFPFTLSNYSQKIIIDDVAIYERL